MEDHERLSPKSKAAMYTLNIIIMAVVAVIILIMFRSGVMDPVAELFDVSLEDIRYAVYVSAAAIASYMLIAPQIFYARYRYRVDGESIDVRCGILFIRRTMVPIERIHQIEVTKDPIKRLFGLANVRVTTAGGIARIRYLGSERAEEIAEALIAMVDRIMKEMRNESE